MKNSEIIEIVATYCDVCGKNITYENRCGLWGKDFCMSTQHQFFGKKLSCFDLYEKELQIKSADIGF